MIICGIDPGKANGGIVFIIPDQPVKCYPMKKIAEAKQLLELLEHYKAIDEVVCFVEKQSLRRNDNPAAAFGMQKLFNNYQMCLNCLDIAGIKTFDTHPRTWQSQLRLIIKGLKEPDKVRKNRYKSAAQLYFPEVKAVEWNADALLIAEYGRRELKININKWRKTGKLF